MKIDDLSGVNLYVASFLKNIEEKECDNGFIKASLEKIKYHRNYKKGIRWKQLYYRLSYEPLKYIIVEEIFNGIEPTFEQHFSKKYWKYPSSLSFRNKYPDDVQSRVIETFREMSADDIENGNHQNISLCSGLRPGHKKLYKWKEPRVRIIYGTIKRDHYLNVVFFDSSGMRTTSDHSHSKDKNDILKYQKCLEDMEANIVENGVSFEDSDKKGIKIKRITIDRLFESVYDFDSEFVDKIVENIK